MAKTLEQLFEGYYSPLKSLSYGRPLIFSVGTRGIGKSTGWPAYYLWRYLRDGSRFCYIRRTDDELKRNAPTFLLNGERLLRDGGYEFEPLSYKAERFYMGKEMIGYAVALSIQTKLKSTPFENCNFSLFDEFMAGRGGSKYLGGRAHPMQEVENFEILFQTIDREFNNPHRNKLVSTFIGNADTFFNPFFIAHKVDKVVRPETKYAAPEWAPWVYENTDEVEATKNVEDSNAYKISVLTRGYAYANEFSDNKKSEFVDKDPKGERFAMFNFAYDGKTYGVYRYSRAGFIYITDRAIEGRQTFALTTEDHTPNHLLIRQWHGNQATILVKEMYDLGHVKFKNLSCKRMLDFYMKYDII